MGSEYRDYSRGRCGLGFRFLGLGFRFGLASGRDYYQDLLPHQSASHSGREDTDSGWCRTSGSMYGVETYLQYDLLLVSYFE